MEAGCRPPPDTRHGCPATSTAGRRTRPPRTRHGCRPCLLRQDAAVLYRSVPRCARSVDGGIHAADRHPCRLAILARSRPARCARSRPSIRLAPNSGRRLTLLFSEKRYLTSGRLRARQSKCKASIRAVLAFAPLPCPCVRNGGVLLRDCAPIQIGGHNRCAQHVARCARV